MAKRHIETHLTIVAPDGVQIPAIELRPPSAPIASILLLHGITTDKNEYGDFFIALADAFADLGIASLRIDFRGHGESCESSCAFSITSQVLDTISAVKWLTDRFKVKVHLLGCSFGAPPAIFTSALAPSSVATISLICPVLDYCRTFLRPTTEWAAGIFNSETLDRAFKVGTLRMNDRFVIDVKLLIEMSLIVPSDSLRRIRCSTLVIHGEQDSMVPSQLSVGCTSGLDHVHLTIIPGMEHGYYDSEDETGESPKSRGNLKRIINEVYDQVSRA